MVGHVTLCYHLSCPPWPHALWKSSTGQNLGSTDDPWKLWRQTSALGVKIVAKFFHGRQWGKTMPASAGPLSFASHNTAGDYRNVFLCNYHMYHYGFGKHSHSYLYYLFHICSSPPQIRLFSFWARETVQRWKDMSDIAVQHQTYWTYSIQFPQHSWYDDPTRDRKTKRESRPASGEFRGDSGSRWGKDGTIWDFSCKDKALL